MTARRGAHTCAQTPPAITTTHAHQERDLYVHNNYEGWLPLCCYATGLQEGTSHDFYPCYTKRDIVWARHVKFHSEQPCNSNKDAGEPLTRWQQCNNKYPDEYYEAWINLCTGQRTHRAQCITDHIVTTEVCAVCHRLPMNLKSPDWSWSMANLLCMSVGCVGMHLMSDTISYYKNWYHIFGFMILYTKGCS